MLPLQYVDGFLRRCSGVIHRLHGDVLILIGGIHLLMRGSPHCHVPVNGLSGSNLLLLKQLPFLR